MNKVESHAGLGPNGELAHDGADPVYAADDGQNDIVLTAATVAVVGAGVVIFEAALLPGMVLGVATMLAPKLLPGLGGALNPVFRSGVRGAYKVGQKAKEIVAEAHEHVNDIVAEAHAETGVQPQPAKPAKPQAAKSAA